MKQYIYRNGYEEKRGNVYAVAFDVFLKYPVEIFDNDQWIDAESVAQVSSVLQALPSKRWWDMDGRILYSSKDLVVFLHQQELFLAIARDPMGLHELMSMASVRPFSWNEIPHIYRMVVNQASLVQQWPELSPNPEANAIQPNYWMMESWSESDKNGHSLFDKYPQISRLQALPSTDMTLCDSFTLQIDKQIPLWHLHGLLKSKGSVRRFQKLMLKAISDLLIEKIHSNGSVYLPYIGTFTLRGTRLCFSSARLLSDRIKGKKHMRSLYIIDLKIYF